MRRTAGAIALVAVLASGCTSTAGEDRTEVGAPSQEAVAPSQEAAAPSQEDGTGGTTVEIETFQYTPEDLEVKVGETVTWVNNDKILHTVTLGTRDEDEQGQPINVQKDGTLDLQLDGEGTSGSYTFEEPGTYTYFCDRHPGMDATVTVS